MKKIFIDTNILLDVILYRDGFFMVSAKLWADCECGKIQGFISAISLNNMHFIMRKITGMDMALEYLRIVMDIFTIVPLDETILRDSLNSPYKDFEDAIQLFSAVKAQTDFIITRDPNHFPKNYMAVLSPVQYYSGQ